MPKQMADSAVHELEAMVDQYSLQTVLYALQSIALDKADHILASYSDRILYKVWLRCAGLVASAAAKVGV